MTILTIWSEGGGVGKTTTTFNLAAALGRLQNNVLLIDLDPQPGSLTDYAGYPEQKSADLDVTITETLLDDDASLADVIIEDVLYDIAPAHESLATLESTVRAEGISMAEFLLQSALTDVVDDYDYVLIDPPATLNLLVDNALIASDEVLVPAELTRKGKQSVEGVLETVDALESQLQRARPDFELPVRGVLPNKDSGSTLNQEVHASLVADDDIPVLDVSVPDYNVLETAWEHQQNIFTYADEHGLQPYQESILDAYLTLAEHLMDAHAMAPEPEVTA